MITTNIKTFDFNKTGFSFFKTLPGGHNWPVVYLIEDGKELYIWETTNIYARSNQHIKNKERKKLPTIHIISDEEYNKSAILDTESFLIQYMFADGKFKLQNANKWILNHNYFDREKYKAKMVSIWNELQNKWLVNQDLVQLKNSDIFKYSPYKALTEDQLDIVENLVEKIKQGNKEAFIINWKPWTGKTILAIYLVKALADNEETKHLKVWLVIPMSSLRTTVERVFAKIKGLNRSIVIGPSDVIKDELINWKTWMYDILIIDESHRLKRRRNIVNYNSHDTINKKLELWLEWTELDWIMKSSKQQILLYDANQSIRPSDVSAWDFKKLRATYYDLETQVRIEWGQEFIDFVENIFDLQKPKDINFKNYDFKIFENLDDMVSTIKMKDKEYWLARLVAWFAWPWISKDNKSLYDIQLWETKLQWNYTNKDWVNSPNAVNEVWCIHTVQWYDLNYVGVIIGPELSYDPIINKFIIMNDNYHDTNGWRGVEDPEELKWYIINIYKTLLTRGIKWCYIYCVDASLQTYFNKIFS